MPAADGRSSDPNFALSKWYLDCVADNGDALIVYVADLKWKSWHTRYASTLQITGQRVEVRSSLRKCSLPERIGDEITLNLQHLGVTGIWTSLTPPIERTIFENSNGAVRWRCWQPAARVSLSLRPSATMSGLGYAELLDISISPWSLPLRELHWGRFVSEKDSVVWIDWRGAHCFRILFHDGIEQNLSEISEQGIAAVDSSLQLSLDRGLVLRSGILGRTVFPTIAKLARTLPVKMLNVQETKWRSRSTLRTKEGITEGWSIHEVVTWAPK